MRCDICGNLTDRKVKFNFMEVYREAHEWTDLPQIGVPCRECIGWIRDKEGFKNVTLKTEPLGEMPGSRQKWEDVSGTAIGVFVGVFVGEVVGLRCAKVRYGVNVVDEVLQGYWYCDMYGTPLQRAVTPKTPETARCAECKLSLWACNALEVTV
jgi:hypothetical protein